MRGTIDFAKDVSIDMSLRDAAGYFAEGFVTTSTLGVVNHGALTVGKTMLAVGLSTAMGNATGKYISKGKVNYAETAQAVIISAATAGVLHQLSKPTINKGRSNAAKGAGKTLSASDAAKKILNAERTGSALKSDVYHNTASYLSKSQLSKGKTFNLVGGDGALNTLLQVGGEVNWK